MGTVFLIYKSVMSAASLLLIVFCWMSTLGGNMRLGKANRWAYLWAVKGQQSEAQVALWGDKKTTTAKGHTVNATTAIHQHVHEGASI